MLAVLLSTPVNVLQTFSDYKKFLPPNYLGLKSHIDSYTFCPEGQKGRISTNITRNRLIFGFLPNKHISYESISKLRPRGFWGTSSSQRKKVVDRLTGELRKKDNNCEYPVPGSSFLLQTCKVAPISISYYQHNNFS